jgi:hypothetical protein
MQSNDVEMTAAGYAGTIVRSFGSKVILQVIVVFQNSCVFVLSLQTNNLLQTWIKDRTLKATQFGFIALFIVIAILFSYIREIYTNLIAMEEERQIHDEQQTEAFAHGHYIPVSSHR